MLSATGITIGVLGLVALATLLLLPLLVEIRKKKSRNFPSKRRWMHQPNGKMKNSRRRK
jgi:hypothetical protein